MIRLRVLAEALPALGLRVLALEPGAPSARPPAAGVTVRPIAGGLEIVDDASGLRVVHDLVDEDDRGDLYDFCPVEGAAARGSRESDLGVRLHARVIDRRVEIEAEIDNRRPDHRLRARFGVERPSRLFTDTAFGWVERAAPGTHPVASITAGEGFALGGLGLHEIERSPDGAILLTLLRAVGWMSRGDLSTRAGHAGYHVPTPDAQLQGRHRLRYTLAFGDQAVRQVESGLHAPYAVALAGARPAERGALSIEPPEVRLSIVKRADEGDGLVLRLTGPPGAFVEARLRWTSPPARASLSDLDERAGTPVAIHAGELRVPIPADEVATLRLAPRAS